MWLKTDYLSSSFIRLLALPALIIMTGIYAVADGWDPFIWDGGMAMFDIATLIVIVSLAMGAFPPLPVLTHSWMEWIGKISYGLYIWQIPVLALLNRHAPDIPRVITAILAVVLTVACGALSYYMVEQPVRRSQWVARLGGALR